MVTLNRAVAVAMARGPQARLDLLAPLESNDRALPVRGAPDHSLPERRYLEERAARLRLT